MPHLHSLCLLLWGLTTIVAAELSGEIHEQHVFAEQKPRKIAIIGAGAGGASTAYYLRNYSRAAGIEADITVFERAPYIGGRSTTVDVYGNASEPVEVGASIFVTLNRILVSAVEELGLETSGFREETVVEGDEEDGGGSLGVWDGEKFVFTQSAGSSRAGWWWNTAKLLWKYGWDPIRAQNLMKATVEKFLRMYETPHFPFRSLERTSIDLALTGSTGSTGQQLMDEHGVGAAFQNDIVQASTRVNYAQNLDTIHGLEAMVCLATDGAMSVKGGNWQIFAGMIARAEARVRLNTTVTDVTRGKGGTFKITYTGETSIGKTESKTDDFDTVVLAAPIQFSGLSINPTPENAPEATRYVKLYVTLFTSPYRLRPSYFTPGADDEKDRVPEVILTTRSGPQAEKHGAGKTGVWSISLLRRVYTPKGKVEYLYKIFSPTEMSSAGVEKMLRVGSEETQAVTWVHRHVWHSYPYLYPRDDYDSIMLFPPSTPPNRTAEWESAGAPGVEKGSRSGGMWYTSPIETFISTMETSALSGMNIARLVVDAWTGI